MLPKIVIFTENYGVQVDLAYKSTSELLAQNCELDTCLLNRSTLKHAEVYK